MTIEIVVKKVLKESRKKSLSYGQISDVVASPERREEKRRADANRHGSRRRSPFFGTKF